MRVAVTMLLFALLVPGPAEACRCMQRNLAEYFSDADTVAVGRLVGSDETANNLQLRFELPGPVYKGQATSSSGRELSVLTAKSTASCGIQAQASAIYLIFAHKADNGSLRVNSCNGTRIHLPAAGGEPSGFDDVPARNVIQQLNSLAALDVLQQVSANAPQPAAPDNDKLIGLLDLAALAQGGEIYAYSDRDSSATPVARITDYAAVESREYDYEVAGAVVYAHTPGWYRLRLHSGSFAWIRAADADTFFPYPAVAVNRLNYLTGNWSGFVWPEAGAGHPYRDSRVAATTSEVGFVDFPAEVHEVRVIAGMPFLRVTVLDGEPCSGPQPGIRVSGWIPAYGRHGQPTAWFWSRGC